MQHADTQANDTRTDLTDSLLHTDPKRVFLGLLCGVAAGLLMLVVTFVMPPAGQPKLWWIQLLATICYGGSATDFVITTPVLVSGLAWHFGLAALCGLIVGKFTQTTGPILFFYCFVLGFLCWLASNMFGPATIHQLALDSVGQWHRMLIFQSFTLSLAAFLLIVSKTVRT